MESLRKGKIQKKSNNQDFFLHLPCTSIKYKFTATISCFIRLLKRECQCSSPYKIDFVFSHSLEYHALYGPFFCYIFELLLFW